MEEMIEAQGSSEVVVPQFAASDAPQVRYINRYDDGGTRWYYHVIDNDGTLSLQWYRSVTTVLDKVMPSSPELFKWAVENFGNWQAYLDYMNKAADYGTLLHLAFRYLLTVPLEFTNEAINALTRQLCNEAGIAFNSTYPQRITMDCYCLWRWIKEYKVRPLLIECPVFCPVRRTAGCTDSIVWLTQPGSDTEELFIVDLKSGARDGTFYPSHQHQLIEYRHIIRNGCLGDIGTMQIGIANLSPKNLRWNSRAFYNFKVWDFADTDANIRHDSYMCQWLALSAEPDGKVKVVTGNSFEQLSYKALTATEFVLSEERRKREEAQRQEQYAQYIDNLPEVVAQIQDAGEPVTDEPVQADHIADAINEIEALVEIFADNSNTPTSESTTPENSPASASAPTQAPASTPMPAQGQGVQQNDAPIGATEAIAAIAESVVDDASVAKKAVATKRASRMKKKEDTATESPTAESGNVDTIAQYLDAVKQAPGSSIVLLKDGALYKAYGQCALLFCEATGTAISEVDIIGSAISETIEAVVIHEAAYDYCVKKCADAGYAVYVAVADDEPQAPTQTLDEAGLPADGSIFYIYRISQPVFKAKRGGDRMFIVDDTNAETGAFYDVAELQAGEWRFAWTKEDAEKGKQILIDKKLPF